MYNPFLRRAYRQARGGRKIGDVPELSRWIPDGLVRLCQHRDLVGHDYYFGKPFTRMRRRYLLSATGAYHLVRLTRPERYEHWVDLDDDWEETHTHVEITFDWSDPEPESCKILDSRLVHPKREPRRALKIEYFGAGQRWWRDGLFHCLIAGSQLLETKLLSLPTESVWVPRDGWEPWEEPIYALDLAVRELCAGRIEEARREFRPVRDLMNRLWPGEVSRWERYAHDLLDLFAGLLEGCPAVQTALARHIERDDNWSTINDEALAYVVLARRLGYDPRVDHFSLPLELIDSHTPPPAKPRSSP